jgi:hypothetical protein
VPMIIAGAIIIMVAWRRGARRSEAEPVEGMP